MWTRNTSARCQRFARVLPAMQRHSRSYWRRVRPLTRYRQQPLTNTSRVLPTSRRRWAPCFSHAKEHANMATDKQVTSAVMAALVGGDANTAANILKAERMIGEARTTLMLAAPFYGAIALRLTLHADVRKSSGTCATDGRGLYYNPDWIVTLKPRALVG